MAVKILVYTMKARCVNLVAKISTSHNENDRPFFSVFVNTRMLNTQYCSAKHEWQLKTVIIRHY